MPKPVTGPSYGWDNKKERVCKLDQVGKNQLAEFEKSKIPNFQINDWFVSFDHQQEPHIFGPFESSEIAFNHCVKNLNIEQICNTLDSDPNITFGKE